jgi:alpha-N-arabinofuranosidase
LGSKINLCDLAVLASGKVQNYNSFEQPEKVKPGSFTGATLKNGVLTVKMPAASVVVLALK